MILNGKLSFVRLFNRSVSKLAGLLSDFPTYRHQHDTSKEYILGAGIFVSHIHRRCYCYVTFSFGILQGFSSIFYRYLHIIQIIYYLIF